MASTAGGAETREALIEAAEACLLEHGYAGLSTRRVAERAGMPMSQIHYHFGSKGKLLLGVLEALNRRLLERQSALYSAEMPLSEQWERACDYLEEDLRSGYVRVLQEMIAAGWSDPAVATAVRQQLRGWLALLIGVARRAREELGDPGTFEPEEVAALVGAAFLGAESLILLGIDESEAPLRAALRRFGEAIRAAETGRGRLPGSGTAG